VADTVEGATQALASISQRDANFDIEAFLSQVASTYLRVARARGNGQPDDVRDVIADSAWSELRLDAPVTDDPPRSSPVLSEPEVARASTDALDTIVVRFSATGKGGERRVEDWTFQRPATALTAPPEGVKCAQCGARGSIGPDGRCRYCGATAEPTQWKVTRATMLDPATSTDVVRTGSQLGQALAAYMAAAAAAGATTSGRPATGQAPALRRRTGCGCGSAFWLIVGAVGASIYGWLVPSTPVHRVVATVIPGIRRAHLSGQLSVLGATTAAGSYTGWWENPVRCSRLAGKATAMSATIHLADGATTTLTFRTSGEPFGTVPRQRGSVDIVASYDRAQAGVHQVWALTPPAATVKFVVTGDGSGEASFGGLSATLTGPGAPTGPLSGSAHWTCRDN
jgi:hypothetical protein